MYKTILIVLTASLSAQHSNAQSIEWTAPVDGVWGSISNWSTENIPDTPTEIAIFQTPGMYTVTADGSLDIGGIDILNPQTTLNVPGSFFYEIYGSVINNGLIRINSDLSQELTNIRFRTVSTLSGIGSIELYQSPTSENGASISVRFGDRLTIGPDQTIHGSGVISPVSGSRIINNGLIIADDPNTPLILRGPFRDGTGVFRADNAELHIDNNAILFDPIFETLGTGHIRIATVGLGVATFRNAINTGDIRLEPFGDLNLQDSFTNNGSVDVGDHGVLNIANTTTIDGTGEIRFLSFDSDLNVFSGHTLTVGPNQSLTGSATVNGDVINNGIIEFGTAYLFTSLANEGTIASTVDKERISINGDVTGNGLFLAQTGDMNFTAAFVHNSTLTAQDGDIYLTNSTVINTTFESLGPGIFLPYQSTLIEVINNATIDTSLGLCRLGGSLQNNALISIDPFLPSESAILYCNANSSITGPGTIVMAKRTSHPESVSTRIQMIEGVTLTIGEQQVLEGSGLIDGSATNSHLVLNGIALANDPANPLRLEGNFSGTGAMLASNSSFLVGSDTTLSGLILESTNNGFFEIAESNSIGPVYDNIIHNGWTTIPENTKLTPTGTLVNSGTIELGTGVTDPDQSTLRIASNFVFEGSGRILMHSDKSVIAAGVKGLPANIGPLQTVEGTGKLQGGVVLQGSLDPSGTESHFLVDDIEFKPTARLLIDLVDPTTSNTDQLIANHNTQDFIQLGGTLVLNADPSYRPQQGDSWQIISGGAVSGSFNTIQSPETYPNLDFIAQYDPSSVTLILSCTVDFSGDGMLDFFDISAFLSAFSSGESAADFTGDGAVDFFDVSAFLQAFTNGCP